MRRSSLLLLGMLFAMTVVLTGCATDPVVDDDIAAPGEVTVGMEGSMFDPSSVTIESGQSVTWVNDDTDIHTVTGEGFDSGQIAPGGSFTWTFDDTGVHEYECTIHPGMDGSVTVE